MTATISGLPGGNSKGGDLVPERFVDALRVALGRREQVQQVDGHYFAVPVLDMDEVGAAPVAFGCLPVPFFGMAAAWSTSEGVLLAFLRMS